MKKYDFAVAPSLYGFEAQVIRRKTSRGISIEDSRDGFLTQEEAIAWGAKALSNYLARRQMHKTAQRESRTRSRSLKRTLTLWLRQQTFRGLADCVASGKQAALAEGELRARAREPWEEVVFRALKDGATEKHAIAKADEHVGKRWTDRLERAHRGSLDILTEGVHALSVANSKRILNITAVFQNLSGGRLQA